MGVNVAIVMIHRVLIEVLQDHVSNFTVISLQVSVASTFPETQKIYN